MVHARQEPVSWGTEVAEEPYRGHPGLQYTVRPRSVLEMLDGVEQWGDRTFVVQGRRRISYSDFAAAVDRAALHLQRRADIVGRRVMLLAYNSPEFVLAVWAIWRAGGVPVMANRWWGSDEIDHAVRLTEPALALTDLLDAAVAGVGVTIRLQDLSVTFESEGFPGVSVGESPASFPVAEDDEALVIFTSGSSGAPKAVALSHRSVVANQHNLLVRSKQLPLDRDPGQPQTVSLVCTPLFHVGGVSNLITQPIIGGRLVLNEGKFDPLQVLQIIEQEGVHRWGGVPTMANRVLEHPDFERFDLSTLKSFPLGGAQVSQPLLDRIRRKLPQMERRGLANTWGMTESGGFITVAGNRDLARYPDTVGTPYPTAEIRIDAPDGEGVGEILVRSPTVMTAYLGMPDDRTVDADGWLRTGDLGRLSDDGYLFLEGRAKDIIIRGGENIACKQVEQALLLHPDVHDVAVVGLPHEDLGEEVAAVVVRRTGSAPTPDDLKDFAREHLAYFAVPTRWFIQTEELPVLAGEKVDKKGLRARIMVTDGMARS
jgi:long-chain acyl-CoA synthetase